MANPVPLGPKEVAARARARGVPCHRLTRHGHRGTQQACVSTACRGSPRFASALSHYSRSCGRTVCSWRCHHMARQAATAVKAEARASTRPKLPQANTGAWDVLNAGRGSDRRGPFSDSAADVWWHGTLLSALRRDFRLRRTLGDGGSRLDGERLATWWRLWKLRQDGLTPQMTGVQAWQPTRCPVGLKVVIERPRRRKLHRLPREVTLALQDSNT
jgi:hypothetical protein